MRLRIVRSRCIRRREVPAAARQWRRRRPGSGDADLGSVWVANAAELPGFRVPRRTTGPRKPLFHGLSRIRRHQPDGQGTIPQPCVAGSIPARGAAKYLVGRLRLATIDPKTSFGWQITLVLPSCLDSVVRYSRVEIHSSARRHGVKDLDIQHAVEHSLAIEDIGEDPDRWLVIGPDRAGNLLELVVLVDQRGEIVIHAMALRPKYRKLLEP